MEQVSTNLCNHENWREIDTWPFCNDCGKRLDEPPSEERWSIDNPATCDVCSTTFDTHSRLGRHKRLVHHAGKYNPTPPAESLEDFVSDNDPTCANCGFGEWRHKDGFNCKEFIRRTEPTVSVEKQTQEIYDILYERSSVDGVRVLYEDEWPVKELARREHKAELRGRIDELNKWVEYLEGDNEEEKVIKDHDFILSEMRTAMGRARDELAQLQETK